MYVDTYVDYMSLQSRKILLYGMQFSKPLFVLFCLCVFFASPNIGCPLFFFFFLWTAFWKFLLPNRVRTVLLLIAIGSHDLKKSKRENHWKQKQKQLLCFVKFLLFFFVFVFVCPRGKRKWKQTLFIYLKRK